MKKRRPCVRNYSPTQKYSRTHERFPIRARSTHDSKGRTSRRSYPKLQQNNGQFDNVSHLKKDAFCSLESLFDVKKYLNLRDVYPLAFDYCRNKSTEKKSVEASDIVKSEPLVETLFLQSFSPRTNLEPYIFKLVNAKNEITVNKELQTKVSNSAQELQQNDLVYHQQNRLINMAENEGEAPEEQKQDEDVTVEKESVIMENFVEDRIEDAEKDEKKDQQIDIKKEKIEDKKVDDEDKIDGEYDEDKGKDEENGSVLPEKPPSFPIAPTLAEELKTMNEKCIILANEIQQLKREVTELSEKPELTEEDTVAIQKRQNILLSKVAELENLTQQFQNTALKDVRHILEESLYDVIEVKQEVIEEEEEEIEMKKRDIEPSKIPEKDRFEFPQIEYPEDKLPRVIICGQTEDQFPKIVIADSERKGREKRFEKLTGKLTESLTMQEKLVQENAQLEGGKYKLEEALLEKDAAIESLERKVCGLQAEMRMVVKENTELSRRLATLNQLVTSPTCPTYTSPGVVRSSPPTSPTSPSLPPHSYASTLPRNDVSCQCKCCLSNRSQLVDGTWSPEAACVSSRLSGGGSRTEGCCLDDSNVSQNVEMCSQGPALVKTPLPRGVCPAELEDKLTIYGTNTKQLEQQLGNMESEVRNMQMELANVQRERQQLEQQRKLLKCTGPCAPCACCPPPLSTCVTPSALPLTSMPSKGPVVPTVSSAKVTIQAASPMSTGPCTNAPMGIGACAQQQLRDLREQYARLQEDYKNKLCEVSCMRTDAEKIKQEVRDVKEEKERMEIKMIDAQERLKLLEVEKGKFEGHKEQLIEQEQALLVAKQRVREAQDELEENRSLIQDLSAQLEDYRNKYLQAQQQVEEQRRQLDLMEMDNARMNENVTLEIGRVKNQFQEKLAELAPLPEILKQSQTKLQEVQQMRLVAERNCENLSRELLGCKDKIQNLQSELDALRTEYQALQDEKGHGSDRFEEMEKKCSELRHENERLKNTLTRLEEQKEQLQKRIDEKMHENTQLSSMLEQVREDSARQVARTKERCETMRWSMQRQVAEMEKQLAQCRATARAAQRDRDEIRQKMQGQINNLNEAFEHAQGRIRSLQGHVNYLKTSYSNIFIGQGETPTNVLPGDAPGMGHDSCDCNY